MTDAVFVVIKLAWLLTTHSWLTASSARVRYANGLTGPTLVTSRGTDGHTGALARARPDLGRAGQGVQPRIVGCDVHDARALVGRMAGVCAWNISHHGFGMHPPLRSIT